MKTAKDFTETEWNEFVKESYFPYYTLNRGWFLSMEKTYPNLKSVVFKQKDSIFPCMIDVDKNSLFSPTPFGGVGGPTKIEYLEFYLKEIDSYCKSNRIKTVEMHLPQVPIETEKILEKNGYMLYKNTYLIVKTKGDIESIFQKIEQRKRRYISKTQIQIKEVKNPDNNEIRNFYDIYLKVMERNNATSRFSLEHFYNIANECDVLLQFSFLENKLVGSSFLLNSEKIISTYYSVVYPEMYKTRAADVLFWNLIKKCTEEGMCYADLGPSSVNSSNFMFKTSFGAETFNFVKAIKSFDKRVFVYKKVKKKLSNLI